MTQAVAAERSCNLRKSRSTDWGADRRKIQNIDTMKAKPSTRPMIGASTMKVSVLYQPWTMMTEKMELIPSRRAAFAIAAPAYPPINAWDEEVGSPHHHVHKSQTIAPNRPARTTYWLTESSLIIPLPIVLATAVPRKKAAKKLKAAAQKTASFGERTRVETMVAMLLAES
jgi:hypothetical protein